jgi:hypothetical protein
MAICTIRDVAGETPARPFPTSPAGAKTARWTPSPRFAQLIDSLAHGVDAAHSIVGDTQQPTPPLGGLTRNVSRTYVGRTRSLRTEAVAETHRRAAWR